ncbi:hypothetical protein FAZ15_01040 [Sphingobacterium olei]|uniref:Uncharacterized protein n=1 Tax=Sphingobacterium olei TaxID=2571155 RepID=A0A4U0P685_9SPHI|nr:hypothetical protein [Sphingobacterium olei]TJZ62923.1 hypothetical protein FAZ15_01040 [Sphingobacterium olei]
MSWVINVARAKGSSTLVLENGDRVLKNHIFFAILGYLIGFIFLFFVGLGFYDSWELAPGETWTLYIFPAIMLLALLYGFIYITFYYYNHRVIYNSETVTAYDAWGRAKSIRWTDLKDAEFNVVMQEIRPYSKQGCRIVMGRYLYGLDDFTQGFATHHPYLVQRILDRPLF